MMTKRFALALALASGCAGGEAPSVEVVSASPDALVTADDALDDLTIVVRYQDPTGDLGGGVALVHDCRSASVVTSLEIPTIANPAGVQEGIAISGELELVVTDVGTQPSAGVSEVCDTAGAQAGAFCVVLVDAAGNESEPGCTQVLAIQ
jgi:hypothetical protein